MIYNLLPRLPPFFLVQSVGIGVTSSVLVIYKHFVAGSTDQRKNLPIRPILIPARASALKADCAPGPGAFDLFPPVPLILI